MQTHIVYILDTNSILSFMDNSRAEVTGLLLDIGVRDYEFSSLHFALFGKLILLKQDSRGKRPRFDEFQIDALPIWK